MGREAVCACDWAGQRGEVWALLETHELILRGDIKKKVPIAGLKSVRVAGDDLVFKVGPASVALTLGAQTATSWAKKIAAPPPSLKDKLGLKDGDKAFVIGAVTDAALAAALKGATTKTAAAAKVAVTQIENEKDLVKALRACPAGTPIWVIHRKGKASPYGEAPVRTLMGQDRGHWGWHARGEQRGAADTVAKKRTAVQR
ncbi:MAG: hypothetical protein AB7E79_02270 [Rhodospirillaceae bacterium]